MRILPYESAAVKVRVEAWAAKLGLFLVTRSANGGFAPGRSAARTVESPGAKLAGGSLALLAVRRPWNRQSLRKVADPDIRYRSLSACPAAAAALRVPTIPDDEELSCHAICGLLFALLASLLLALSATAQETGIRWQQDIESAKVMARDSGRLVLVHVVADGCGPCRSLETECLQPARRRRRDRAEVRAR